MIRTRDMLIDWLRENTKKDRVIHTAVHTGRIENYGIFSTAPGSTEPGWVLAIATPQGRYQVVVICSDIYEFARWYRVRPGQVDWAKWGGDTTRLPIYQGDEPEVYRERKEATLRAESLRRSDPS